MATTQIFELKTGEKLELTTAEQQMAYKEAVLQDKLLKYNQTTFRVIPGTSVPPVDPPPTAFNYLSLPVLLPTTHNGKADLTITRKFITNPNGVSMNILNSRNIKFIECTFGFSLEEGISFENSDGLTVERCLFYRNAGSIYGLNSKNINVIDCRFVNTRQRPQGGRGQFLQANACDGVSFINNKGENFAGESDPEDMVSMFNSRNGVVRNNILRGGGPSTSGSAIMLGDYGGANQIAELNKIVRSGNAGIGVAGGNNIQVLNNMIWSDRTAVSNNPLYVWAQAGATGNGVIVKGNRVNWTDKTGAKNNGWNSGNIPNTQWENPTTIELSQMGVPDHLIDFITVAQLGTIRK